MSKDRGSIARTDALLQYGNVNALNADLSGFAVTGAFLLRGWTLDQDTVNGTITVVSGASTSSVNVTLLAAALSSPADYTIPFSAFTGINWADVDVIRLHFSTNGLASQASSLQGFSIIPAPGAAAILGLGGVLAARRRR